MANIVALQQSHNTAGIGGTGIVLLKIKAARGYSISATHIPGAVYKFALREDRDILEEIHATNTVRSAFAQAQSYIFVYTPLLATHKLVVKWKSSGTPHSTGVIHCIPMRRFRTNGRDFFLSIINKPGPFIKTLDSMLYIYMRFLDIIHSKGVIHMDLNLQNSLFDSVNKVDNGVISDFQCSTKRLKLGGSLSSDAWMTPLLAKWAPPDRAEYIRKH